MKEISWSSCLRLGLTGAAVLLLLSGQKILAALLKALWPLLLGGGLAYVMDIPMAALERRLFPRGGRPGRAVCLTLTLLGSVTATLWLAGAILPEMLRCLTRLMGCLPEALARLAEKLQSAGAAQWLRSAGLPEASEMAEHGVKLAMEAALSLMDNAATALTTLAAGTANALLALVFAAYLLSGKERIAAQASRLSHRLWSDAACTRLRRMLKALHGAFRAYVVGQCAEAVILGCLCLIGMALLKLPGALMISAMAGVTALLPLVGAPLATAVGAVLLLPEGGAAAWTFVIFFLILQQVESNLIAPRVVGASLGLPAVWTLAAMLLGGGLFGLVGAVLAVPAAAATRKLLADGPGAAP